MLEGLVSIIVPVYKIKEEYLRFCVNSLLRQTYGNFEVILVDDGSPDNCGRICDEYAALEERIVVIHQANAGVSAARNAGLNRAQGEYIVFVDPDDYLEDVFLEQMIKQMPDNAQIIACCAQIIGGDFTDTDYFFARSMVFADEDIDEDMDILDEECAYPLCGKQALFLQLMDSNYGQPQIAYTAIGVPWGKVYRAEFIQEYQLRFDTGLPRMQDNLFNMYAFYEARKILYINEPLYNYRYEHVQQYSTEKRRSFTDIFYVVCEARQQCLLKTGMMKDLALKKAYQEELFGFLLTTLYMSIYHSSNRYSIAEKKEELQKLIRRPLYQDLLREFNPASVKNKIYLYAIRHNCFALINLTMHLREWKEGKSAKNNG